MGCKFRQALFGLRQLARQEFAFGSVKFEGERELMLALPAILRQQDRPGGEIAERGCVGGGGFGAFTRDAN